MSIMLGNLKPEEIAERLCVEFPQDVINHLYETRQENVANELEYGKWHCFDIPFQMVCDSEATAKKLYELLKDYCKNAKCGLSIVW